MHTKNELSSRFITAYEALLKGGQVADKRDFALRIGVSPSMVTEISKGRSNVGTLAIQNVVSMFNIDADWLLTGRGEMFKSPAPSNNEPTLSNNPAIGTPYYDVDFIGGFQEIFNSQVAIPANNIVIRGFEKADLWCNVTGHSMEPRINHGDIIALRQCTLDDIQYGEIYAVVLDTIRTVKILRKATDPQNLRFIPINTHDYDEQEFSKSRIINIFEVIGSISKFF